MTVREYLRTKGRACELYAIREYNHIMATVWVDYDYSFVIPSEYDFDIVKDDSTWGTIPVRAQNGEMCQVPVHFIDAEEARETNVQRVEK